MSKEYAIQPQPRTAERHKTAIFATGKQESNQFAKQEQYHSGHEMSTRFPYCCMIAQVAVEYKNMMNGYG